MSSGVLGGLVEAPRGGAEGAVDDVGQVALEDAEGGLAGLADGFTALEEGFRAVVAAGLSEGGAMEGGVDLPVPAAVEAVGAVFPVPLETGMGAVPLCRA